METNSEADYADDLVIFVNSPAQFESLLYTLKRAAKGVGL